MSYRLQVPPNRLLKSAHSTFSSLPIDGSSVTSNRLEEEGEEDEDDDDELEALQEDWEVQMERLESLDDWVRLGEKNIPAAQHDEVLAVINSFAGLQRVHAYMLLQAFDWREQPIRTFLDMIHRVEQLLKVPTIVFMTSLISAQLHWVALRLFSFLSAKAIMDFVHNLQQFQGYEIVDLTKYLSKEEEVHLKEHLEDLGALVFYQIMQEIKLSPTGMKHCHLCRNKRIFDLEFRMMQKQLPVHGKPLPVPGVMENYTRHTDSWTSSDEKFYSFDTTVGKIYWHRYPVDLVNICDLCLREVHDAISTIHRNTEVHHLDAAERKEALKAIHSEESELAVIIGQIAHTRGLRRGKEFLLRALSVWQRGKADELRAVQQESNRQSRQSAREKAQDDRAQLIQKALAVDQKWKILDRQSDIQALNRRMNYAMVQRHMGFSEQRPAPTQRKHSRSWSLKGFDEEGLPITEEAARQMFGHKVVEKEPEDASQLNKWREIADAKANIYQRRRDLLQAAKRKQELKELEELKDYVRERNVILDRHQKQMERIAAQAEADRIAQRAAERERRRALRFARYLEEERVFMAEEDRRSGLVRFLLYESVREERERARMFEEECEQCELDRFWGFDYYENCMKQEELRLRQFYEDRVRLKNEQLVNMKCILPAAPPKFTVFGTLPEDHAYDNNQERRLAVIKKLKAEEVRSKLKIFIPYKYR